MNFELSAEQKGIRDLCREFARNEVAPRAADYDESGEFPYDIVARMGTMGLFALPIAESVGGAGADFVSYCLALEELAWADASVAITLEAAVSLGITPIVRFGTHAQQEKWLPQLLRGERLWAFGMTETNAGSDAAATQTLAVRDGDGWVINGGKVFITNAGTEISAGVTITAVMESSYGARQIEPSSVKTHSLNDGSSKSHIDHARNRITCFAIEQTTPGYTQGKKYRKLGWHASDTRELIFNNVRVSNDNIIGEPGKGYDQFISVLIAGRVAIAALSVGLAQACLDASLQYSVQRHQFGHPISEFQATQFKLADMATQIDAARLLTWRAATAIDTGNNPEKYASMAKLYASEVATACANHAVQIHGGYGFMEEYPVARFYRDAKINEIGEGTSEVQRILIARALLASMQNS